MENLNDFKKFVESIEKIKQEDLTVGQRRKYINYVHNFQGVIDKDDTKLTTVKEVQDLMTRISRVFQL